MPTVAQEFPSLRVFDHPLVQHKLTIVRDRRTSPADFRRLLNEIAGLMTYEVSRRFDTRAVAVETPLEVTEGRQLSRPVTLVPILRAGLSMTDRGARRAHRHPPRRGHPSPGLLLREVPARRA
jgi:uracil phosphoribosyltransferase